VTILPLEGGSAIVIASTNASFGAGKEDVWAFRIGETGDVVWQKAYGGAKSEIAYGASMSADGTNVYVTGSTDSFGAGAGDVWLLTLDGANGAIRSQLTFGSAEKAEHGRSVTPMDDGGLLVVGTDPDGLLALRLDADLAVTWQRKYRNTAVVDGWAYGTNAIKTADEGFFFLAGGFERGWLIRTAADGTIGGCKAPGFGTPLAADKFLPKVSTGAIVDTTVVPQPRTTTAFDLGKALVDVPASTTNACE